MTILWERRKILIWGKTRPELSKKYREIVCTGGVFADNRKLVRLYPVPLRYMDDQKVFRKYQWIEASIAKTSSDSRPESYRIKYDDIVIGKTIPTRNGNWDDRAQWIINDQNIANSYEHLLELWQENRTSLKLVKPLEILRIYADPYSQEQRDAFWARYTAATSQMELFVDPDTQREVNPLTPPDFRFKVNFKCDDSWCKGHNSSILDWEIDALYFNLRQRGRPKNEAAQMVVERLETICGNENDLYFYMGNIFSHQHRFVIVGFWWPKKNKQLPLFAG